MGHSDIRTTMDIYAEVTKAKAHSAFQELNEEDVLQGESFNLGSEKSLEKGQVPQNNHGTPFGTPKTRSYLGQYG